MQENEGKKENEKEEVKDSKQNLLDALKGFEKNNIDKRLEDNRAAFMQERSKLNNIKNVLQNFKNEGLLDDDVYDNVSKYFSDSKIDQDAIFKNESLPSIKKIEKIFKANIDNIKNFSNIENPKKLFDSFKYLYKYGTDEENQKLIDEKILGSAKTPYDVVANVLKEKENIESLMRFSNNSKDSKYSMSPEAENLIESYGGIDQLLQAVFEKLQELQEPSKEKKEEDNEEELKAIIKQEKGIKPKKTPSNSLSFL